MLLLGSGSICSRGGLLPYKHKVDLSEHVLAFSEPMFEVLFEFFRASLMFSEVAGTNFLSLLTHFVVKEGFPGSDFPKSGLLSTIKVGDVRAELSSEGIALVLLCTWQLYPYVISSQNRS